jgi:carbonic anhydrase
MPHTPDDAIQRLLANNRAWSDRIRRLNPDFFPTLARQQTPDYLWIGCSDSRVPANEIVGMLPGELFVHRNVANMVVHTDMNLLSVLQFAVEVLKVRHIIVCGHYGCGGVRAALENHALGLIDNWIRGIKDVYADNKVEIRALPSPEEQVDRLCELNVIEQVRNLCHTTIIQSAWKREQPLSVHGWCYGLKDGTVNDLNVSIDSAEALSSVYRYDLSDS